MRPESNDLIWQRHSGEPNAQVLWPSNCSDQQNAVGPLLDTNIRIKMDQITSIVVPATTERREVLGRIRFQLWRRFQKIRNRRAPDLSSTEYPMLNRLT